MADRRWTQAVMPRGQQWLHVYLDDLVTQNRAIRLVDAVLNELDWSEWEGSYSSERRGQPPFHPRLLAGCILYGLLRKLRSSRQLEDATRERLDFQCLLEGRTIDHSTYADFRVAFAEKLKELNRAFARRVVSAHEGALETLVVDGTRLRACSDRHGARTAETLERMIQRCAQVLNERLAALGETDEREAVELRETAESRQEIERLRSEWNWVCCAYNLKLILQMMQETGKRPENTPPEAPSSAHTRLQSLPSRAIDAFGAFKTVRRHPMRNRVKRLRRFLEEGRPAGPRGMLRLWPCPGEHGYALDFRSNLIRLGVSHQC